MCATSRNYYFISINLLLPLITLPAHAVMKVSDENGLTGSNEIKDMDWYL